MEALRASAPVLQRAGQVSSPRGLTLALTRLGSCGPNSAVLRAPKLAPAATSVPGKRASNFSCSEPPLLLPLAPPPPPPSRIAQGQEN